MAGFKQIKNDVITALRTGNYQHEVRSDINVKNLLSVGQVSAADVEKILSNCTSSHMTTSPHHDDSSIDVHVIVKDQWYIKFYFVNPAIFFISVHQ